MKKAHIYLRHTHDRRYELFCAGLKRHGYQISAGLPGTDFGPHDIFVTWNRLAAANNVAKEFEKRGQTVLVAENASWGNQFAGTHWYHIARNCHNTADMFPVGPKNRWDVLNIELADWRKKGETVILAQRSIGSPPVAMPGTWLLWAKKKYGGRVRKHPGKTKTGVSLEEDLKSCGKVVTWGSGAAIKALMMGIPVISEMPGWIGEQDNTDFGRIQMLRRLAWAQWTHTEIENGFVFERLL